MFDLVRRCVRALERLADAYEADNASDGAMNAAMQRLAENQERHLVELQAQRAAAEAWRAREAEHMKVCEERYRRRVADAASVADGEAVRH